MRVVFIQTKNGWLALRLPAHVLDRGGSGLVVDRLHPLAVERPGIFDGLLADAAPVLLLVASSLSLARHFITPRGELVLV